MSMDCMTGVRTRATHSLCPKSLKSPMRCGALHRAKMDGGGEACPPSWKQPGSRPRQVDSQSSPTAAFPGSWSASARANALARCSCRGAPNEPGRACYRPAYQTRLSRRRQSACRAQIRRYRDHGPASRGRGGAHLAVNAEEVAEASTLVEQGGMTSATLDRLQLNECKIAEMVRSMRAVAALPDPLGRVLERTELDDNLILDKVTCPLGVLAVIFEARPDAVTQIGALALKSGNAVVLKAGKEVERTASLLVELMRRAFRECALPEDAVSLVAGREAVQALLGLPDLIDLVIPRGSKQLVEFVQSATRIPVLGHAEGICHVYVHSGANQETALAIIDDAKTDYPAACNAAETVLVDASIAAQFLPKLAN